MKKFFLMAYARQNLGDDLFIKMLLEKYPNYQFYMKVKDKKYLKGFYKYSNLNIDIGDDTDEELSKTDVNKYDGYIYIGGSIFMEGGKVYNLSEKMYDFIKKCKEKDIPFIYISCNYGPYQTNEYFRLSRKTFETCSDICFRDKYSYNLFKDIKTVRYAPDLAFSYDKINKEKIDDSVGISVIDLSIRDELKKIENDYLQFLYNNISEYLKQGKKIYLYSFCQNEGDEEIVNKILDIFKDNKNIFGIKYDGNVDKFLDLYSKMEYMICARFHSMVLSAIANQKVYVISYSKKIDNVIEDLELNLPMIKLKSINKDMKLDLNQFVNIEEQKITGIEKKSKEQLTAMEKI